MYKNIRERLEEIISGESNFIANASNFSALLCCGLKDINWAGFYMVNNDELILGPFQGKLACVRIAIGKGVCGTAAKIRQTIVVDNVEEFPGHIACDPRSKSELVIPLLEGNTLFGVLDIDSPIASRFSQADNVELEELVNMLVSVSDMDAIGNYYEISRDL